MQETDTEMQSKIQRIELVKFNPNNFHMEFFDGKNLYEIIGGAPTMISGVLGAGASFAYYSAGGMSRNFYSNNMRVAGRLSMGLTLGLALGYSRFGDRQRLHNAYLAERLAAATPSQWDSTRATSGNTKESLLLTSTTSGSEHAGPAELNCLGDDTALELIAPSSLF
eukprot:CAMPEP_0185583262 /NCGR_PEP_ID=MMETSP0434-20130131/21416_1 /TAXON_ID=626734 ORGANISM="Favella taraikaensis, Strain Fe Narragansett Bay" /NCGR_SAMPLE_ID=MMETSP0434 /ASSEMBLY_ACC=CAM_ASM_000379 /LENGTH=166 /DNA_ID=CAMNT_0028202289 /DNA_START=60 /DNA_END=561 /DNA_ORIENTATION=+